ALSGATLPPCLCLLALVSRWCGERCQARQSRTGILLTRSQVSMCIARFSLFSHQTTPPNTPPNTQILTYRLTVFYKRHCRGQHCLHAFACLR
ncbi:hypothetical protein BJ741DRAFT_636402, partial [Chytriomyces cf. hyalinus JEL632]